MPTVPPNFIRRMTLESTATGGQTFRWWFPRGLQIAPSSSLVVWCINNSVATVFPLLDIDVRVDV